MFRFGITTRSQLDGLKTLPDPPPAIAYTLLSEFDSEITESDETALEFLYEKLPAGAETQKRKLTFTGRYPIIDEAIKAAITEVFASEQPVRIHEMAASNAITTLEMFKALRSRNNLTVRATDFFDSISIVTVRGWKIVFDTQRNPVQFIKKQLVISGARPEPNRYIINRLIRAYLMKNLLPEAQQLLISGDTVDIIPLFHPLALSMAETDPGFTLGHDDIFAPAEGQFEVIRIMSAYANFEEHDIQRSLIAIAPNLVEGGLLVVGSNLGRDNKTVPTTIFRKEKTRFSPHSDICGGAVFKSLVLGVSF